MRVKISISEYNNLLSIAKNRFPNCYEDIVHDALLLGLDFEGSKQKLKSLSYDYFTINEVDLTKKYEEKVCIKCNKCLPIACFGIYKKPHMISTRNVCKECKRIQEENWVNNNKERVKENKRLYMSKNWKKYAYKNKE